MNVALAILAILVLLVGVFLFSGFVWMICLGALAHIFNVPDLAIGYWASVVVAIIFSALFGGLRTASK